MIQELRNSFNDAYRPQKYQALLAGLKARAGTEIEFRVAETPIFLPKSMLEEMAQAGAALTRRLLAWPEYLAAARKSIPENFRVTGDSAHPNFLTADFALIRDAEGYLVPRLVELQAFPSVYAYQAMLNEEYARIFGLPDQLGYFLGGLDRNGFWELFRRTVVGNHAPENVILTEVDPQHQKTLPDFLLTSKELGIALVDIATLVPIGDKLHYRDDSGRLIPVDRIYNRAIADEMMAREIKLPFSLTGSWDVEWAGHPNWYFLISKFSVPWLAAPQAAPGLENGEVTSGRPRSSGPVVPPAVFLTDFLSGEGFAQLRAAGV